MSTPTKQPPNKSPPFVSPPTQPTDNAPEARAATAGIDMVVLNMEDRLDMEFSDSEEDAGVANTTTNVKKTVQVIRIKPNVNGLKYPIGGFVVILTGFQQDRAFTAPLFLSKENPTKKGYLTQIKCVQRVVSCYDKEGNQHGKFGADGESFYDTKCLVFSFKESEMTEANIRNFVNTTLRAKIWEYRNATDKCKINRTDLPVMCVGRDYSIVDTWDKAIYPSINYRSKTPEHNIDMVLQMISKSKNIYQKWVKSDYRCIYTMYQVGKVPMHFIKKHNVPLNVLNDIDKQRVLDHDKEVATKRENQAKKYEENNKKRKAI